MSTDATFAYRPSSVPHESTISPGHHHQVEFYEADTVLLGGLSKKFGSVLGAGDAVVVIATEARRNSLANLLRDRGINIQKAIQQGRYIALDAEETLSKFMVDGWPDATRFSGVVGSVLDSARGEGTGERRAVAAFGEMVAVLCEQGKTEAAIRLEQLWNELAGTHSFSLHCAYPLNVFDHESDTTSFQTICSQHSHVVPAESYTSLSDDRDRLRTISLLQQKAQVLQALAEEKQRLATALTIEVEDLRRLHQVSTQLAGLDMHRVMEEVLSAIASLHGTSMGLLSLCDAKTNELVLGASLGFAPEFLKSVERVPRGSGACGTCMDKRERIIVQDTESAPIFAEYRELARQNGFRAVHSTPLLDRSGELLGVVSVHFANQNVPTERQMRLTDLYAQLAASAIENVRLYHEAQEEIARRRAAEKALRESEEFARGIVESSVDCIKVLDQQGRLLYMSPPGQRSLEIQDIATFLGKNWLDFWEGADRERARKILAAAQAGALGRMQGYCPSSSGMPKWWDVTLVPMRTKDGHIDRLLATSREITELRQAQTALLQVEKLAATGRMAATIAHEINNPLEAVTNFIFLAKNSPELVGEARKYLEIADQELARVAFIAQQTLGFYRDNSSPTWVNVAVAVRDLLTLYDRKLSYKKLMVQCDIVPELRVRALAGEFKQALSNLIANAIDASNKGGTIRIRAQYSSIGNYVRITVADHGVGMSRDTQQRLFTAFFTTKEQVGTGLGLWATKNMLKNQQGKIQFRSKEAHGTAMSMVLPLATEGAAGSNA
jgi:PAS domain S-box-containing protein